MGLNWRQTIKADPILALMPVIILTTSSADNDIRAAARLGASGFFTKSLDSEESSRIFSSQSLSTGVTARSHERANARVLLVDDDLVDRLTTRRLLKRARIDVVLEEAETGGAALNAMNGNRYDCIILDYHLPGHDGIDVIATARDRGVTTPILVLTGRGDDDLAATVMKTGANDYLPKDGLDPTRLATSIKGLIDRHRDDRKTASRGHHRSHGCGHGDNGRE